MELGLSKAHRAMMQETTLADVKDSVESGTGDRSAAAAELTASDVIGSGIFWVISVDCKGQTLRGRLS